MDQRPPDVLIEKSETGGVSINFQVKSRISESLFKDILRVYGVHNCRLTKNTRT